MNFNKKVTILLSIFLSCLSLRGIDNSLTKVNVSPDLIYAQTELKRSLSNCAAALNKALKSEDKKFVGDVFELCKKFLKFEEVTQELKKKGEYTKEREKLHLCLKQLMDSKSTYFSNLMKNVFLVMTGFIEAIRIEFKLSYKEIFDCIDDFVEMVKNNNQRTSC